MQWYEEAWRQRRGLPRPVVATIGNYDGVHRGQQAILARLAERARACALPAVVITFEPHPLTVVAPERAPPRLLSHDQKRSLLETASVDAVIEVTFDSEFAATSAERFVREFLYETLAVREVVVGSRFTFGAGQAGDLEVLERLGRELGFAAWGVPEVEYEGAPISSSRIRSAVRIGDIEAAADMLGRVFALRGTIARGERRGRGLGWPTINLIPNQEVIPPRGVYVSQVGIAKEPVARQAVTNVGVRPTVTAGTDLVIESHILDFSADVYGEEAEVSFIEHLRDERTFESIEDLTEQIRLDVRRAREFFARRPDKG